MLTFKGHCNPFYFHLKKKYSKNSKQNWKVLYKPSKTAIMKYYKCVNTFNIDVIMESIVTKYIYYSYTPDTTIT